MGTFRYYGHHVQPVARQGVRQHYDGPLLGELGGQFTSALLGVLQCSVKPERALHGAARDRVDTDGDRDLGHPGPLLPQRSLTPGANGVISRVTGGSLLRPPARLRPLNRDNARNFECARQDSNPQPSDP